jgi:hypothetical protein
MISQSSTLIDVAKARVLLQEIGDELAARGLRYEIAIYGGVALLLQFDNRPATRDIDFTCVSPRTEGLVSVAEKTGAKHGLPAGWFNDAVKQFASTSPELLLVGDFPPNGEGGLRVLMASPRYLLAMKVLEMRSSAESHDVLDIWNLIDACGLKDAAEAEEWVGKFFPGDELTPRRRAILRDIFENKRDGRQYDPMVGW